MFRIQIISMNRLKRVAIQFLSFLFLFSLTACGSAGNDRSEGGWWQETSPSSEGAGEAEPSGSVSGFGGSISLYDSEQFLIMLPYEYKGGGIRWYAEIRNETDEVLDFHFTLFLNGALQPTRSEGESEAQSSQAIELQGGETVLFPFSFEPVALSSGEENTVYACVLFPAKDSDGEFSHCSAETTAKISVSPEHVKRDQTDAFHAVRKLAPPDSLDGSCMFSVYAEEDLSFPIQKPACIPLEKELSMFAVVPQGPLRTYLLLDGQPVAAFGGKLCVEWSADAGILYQIPLDPGALRPDGKDHIVHLLSFHTDDYSLRPETSLFMKAR